MSDETIKEVVEKEPEVKDEPTGSLDADLTKEILEAAANEPTETDLEDDPEKTKPVKKELPPKDKESPAVGEEETGGKAPEVEKEIEKKEEVVLDGIPDDLLTRAVKAGIGIADAKSLDAKALARVCTTLEKASGKEPVEAPSGEETDSEDNLFKDFPELSKDDYDETLVDAFDGLKGMIKKLAKDNKSLTASLNDGAIGDSVDRSIDSLGEDYKAVINPEKRSLIKTQINILTKGYEAAGEKVDSDMILSSALRIVLGDVEAVATAKATKKAAALAKRESQATIPPSEKQIAPTKTAEEEAEKLLQDKFGV